MLMTGIPDLTYLRPAQSKYPNIFIGEFRQPIDVSFMILMLFITPRMIILPIIGFSTINAVNLQHIRENKLFKLPVLFTFKLF
jgi:hypothetical protein